MTRDRWVIKDGDAYLRSVGAALRGAGTAPLGECLACGADVGWSISRDGAREFWTLPAARLARRHLGLGRVVRIKQRSR